MSQLETFLRKNKQYNLKIAVVGDTMIDEYYSVRADRVSPEFPIPVSQCMNPLASAISISTKAFLNCSAFTMTSIISFPFK